jgi:hypothetical protein
MELCESRSDESGLPYICSLHAGHAGPHEAHTDMEGTIADTWPNEREVKAAWRWVDLEVENLCEQGIRPEGPWCSTDREALSLCRSTDAEERRAESERINALARAKWDEVVATYA